MQIKFLKTPWQRSWGATLSRGLGEQVLIFVYSTPSPRLFHTFLCPPLRIIALEHEHNLTPVFDQVVQPNQFVSIPPARIIIECDPKFLLPELQVIAETLSRNYPEAAAWNETVSLDRLLFAILAHAVIDMRRVNERAKLPDGTVDERLRRTFTAVERGSFISSAGYIQEFGHEYSLPVTVIRVARELLKFEKPYMDELLAASVAGGSWQRDFPKNCIRCNSPGIWRMAIEPPIAFLSIEESWRYQRPENFVPLCSKCAYRIKWNKDSEKRHQLVLGVWGPRFEAFERWHKMRLAGTLPEDWSRQDYPLWPSDYGGITWETGSGALEHVAPRPPENITYTERHRAMLEKALARKLQKGCLVTPPT